MLPTLITLKERFRKNFNEHLSYLESYIIGKNSNTDVIDFFRSDFDKVKLKLHRDTFLDVAKTRSI